MSLIENFRNLFNAVAPINTHSSLPFICDENGVLIEGTVFVYKNKIIPLKKVDELVKPIYGNFDSHIAPVNVALIYFTKNHTSYPDSNSLGIFYYLLKKIA